PGRFAGPSTSGAGRSAAHGAGRSAPPAAGIGLAAARTPSPGGGRPGAAGIGLSTAPVAASQIEAPAPAAQWDPAWSERVRSTAAEKTPAEPQGGSADPFRRAPARPGRAADHTRPVIEAEDVQRAVAAGRGRPRHDPDQPLRQGAALEEDG